MSAMLRVGKLTDAVGEQQLIKVKNLSAGGLMAIVTHVAAGRRQVEIELSSQKIPATVVWTRDDMVGLKFDQNVDLGELLAGRKPRHGFRPRPPRLEIACKASVRVGKTYYTVDVHDISLGGMKVEPIEEYCVGKKVVVVVESLRPIKGEVRWYSDRKAGIVFDRPLEFDELAEWVGKRLELASLKASYQKRLTRPYLALLTQRSGTMAEEVAILAGGCFWCTEAVFLDVVGVKSVESGYTGGHVANPTYKQVCGGDTGHAEAIRITFDPEQLSYDDLLDIFFATHDPTQLNRQGNDVGTQYRSAIFPHGRGAGSARRARRSRAPTTIMAAASSRRSSRKGEWYPAEDYHQDYWAGEGQRNPYCLAIIPPKLQKLRKSFQARAKSASRDGLARPPRAAAGR